MQKALPGLSTQCPPGAVVAKDQLRSPYAGVFRWLLLSRVFGHSFVSNHAILWSSIALTSTLISWVSDPPRYLEVVRLVCVTYWSCWILGRTSATPRHTGSEATQSFIEQDNRDHAWGWLSVGCLSTLWGWSMTTLCKRRLNFRSRSCSFRKHHWPLSDGCLGDGDNLQSIDLSGTMVIRSAANIWLYGSFTRLKKQQSSRIWQVTIFHLFSFSCPQEGVSLIQEHKKIKLLAERKPKQLFTVNFLPWVEAVFHIQFDQATDGCSETVFSDNQSQIQEISPSCCHGSE